MKNIIKKKIYSALNIYYFKIIDNSSMHDSHIKNSKHYTLIISAYEFNLLTLLQQHKKIYKIFFKYIPKKIYSMKLYTYNIQEWKKNKKKKILLMPCMQHNKKFNCVTKIKNKHISA